MHSRSSISRSFRETVLRCCQRSESRDSDLAKKFVTTGCRRDDLVRVVPVQDLPNGVGDSRVLSAIEQPAHAKRSPLVRCDCSRRDANQITLNHHFTGSDCRNGRVVDQQSVADELSLCHVCLLARARKKDQINQALPLASGLTLRPWTAIHREGLGARIQSRDSHASSRREC